MTNDYDKLNELDLESPDQNREHNYDWSDDFLQCLLGSLITDSYFLLQSINLVRPEYFRSDAHRTICRLILEHYKNYNDRPNKTILRAEISERVKDLPNKAYYFAELDAVCGAFEPGVEKREYFLDKITEFAKTQALRVAYNSTLDIFKANRRDKWDKIREILQSALLVDRNVDLGLEYFDTIDDRYRRMLKAKEEQDFFITGFPSIDTALVGGLVRGEIGGFAGMCFARDTEVVMYDGTTKKVQDVVVGDLLMGDDSTPRTVVCLSAGYDELYEVKPVKGSSYYVTKNHILSLKNSAKTPSKYEVGRRKRGFRRPHSVFWRHFSRVDGTNVFNISVEDYLTQTEHFKRSMKGYRVGVDFSTKDVRIDPYFLGLWLGDGNCNSTGITTLDEEIRQAIYEEAAKRGLSVRISGGCSYYIYSEDNKIKIPGKGISGNTLLSDLDHYGLKSYYSRSGLDSGRSRVIDKFIPSDYKINSREIRLSVLAGLLDTDGSLGSNCFDFINKSRQLAEDVAFIARSVGLAAYVKKSKKRSQDGTEGIYWRVSISGDCSIIPVRVQRKVPDKRKQCKDHLVTGITVRKVTSGEYFGFEVDGNHLFLLSDFTVVHNSGSGKSLALVKVAKSNLMRGSNVLYISLEMNEDQVAKRFDAMLTDEPIHSLMNVNSIQRLREKLETEREKSGWGDLMIKQFPAGSADVNTCRAYISQLNLHGFRPEVVIIDYVGEMRDYPGIKTYESRERLVRDLRGMAVELGVVVFTAMQVNRGGRDALDQKGYLDDDSLADSAGQIRPMDALWTISQNPKTEQKADVGTLFASKHRDGKGRFIIRLERNPNTLEWEEISNERWALRCSNVSDQIKQEVILEDYAKDVEQFVRNRR